MPPWVAVITFSKANKKKQLTKEQRRQEQIQIIQSQQELQEKCNV
jgi:hypothetical protein